LATTSGKIGEVEKEPGGGVLKEHPQQWGALKQSLIRRRVLVNQKKGILRGVHG